MCCLQRESLSARIHLKFQVKIHVGGRGLLSFVLSLFSMSMRHLCPKGTKSDAWNEITWLLSSLIITITSYVGAVSKQGPKVPVFLSIGGLFQKHLSDLECRAA